MKELYELPQIVASRSAAGNERAAALFGTLSPRQSSTSNPRRPNCQVVRTNTWRYIKFAAANQLYMIANEHGASTSSASVSHGLSDYPWAADIPGAGFAAGPCLFKDTMQLAAFNNNNFSLGHAAMMVNEGLPLYVVIAVGSDFDLKDLTVGILGMAFKARVGRHPLQPVATSFAGSWGSRPKPCSAPTRTSLIDRRPRRRSTECSSVPTSSSSRHLIAEYRDLVTDKPVADVWNIVSGGASSLIPSRDLDRHPRVQRGRRDRFRTSTRILDVGDARIRHSSSSSTHGQHHRSGRLDRYDNEVGSRLNVTTGVDRPTPSGSDLTLPTATVVVVTMADGCDDATQIDDLAQLVRDGIAIAGSVPLHERWMPGRWSVHQALALHVLQALASTTSPGSAPMMRRIRSRRTEPTSCAPSASTAKPGSRSASNSSPRRAGHRMPVAEIPTTWFDRDRW